MMSKLRSLITWSVVFTQVWSPVLAQTLPISVDRNVPGAKPSVGVSNGVPVINIAPPSAGGVSNNRYTQFNVGPSGAVLNNSGGPSLTQLAGQVGGNPMLGNQHARTILNQVTAPNPSQLLGTLEVAGNRANVIVANPAGITCNGCGFLNADRATLTTGKPRVGAEGGIGFDIAAGKIHVDGAGLNGANLSQVDLLARTLQINADVWADRLNVSAGAARVDYASGDVSAQAGQGAAPELALDTAALGGMYANSVRLIGTEAGVGVNIGGNLVALTGDLQLTAAGDVRIAPRGTAQAAGNLRLDSGRDLTVQGTAQVGGAVALAAARDISVQGAVGAGASLSMEAGGDASVGAQGSLRTRGALRVAAGKDLALSSDLLTSDQNVRMQSGRNLKVAGGAAVPPIGNDAGSGAGSGTTSGASSGTGSSTHAGGESGKPRDPAAPGDQDGGASVAGGVVSAKDGITLLAGRDLRLSRQVYASGTVQMLAGAEAVSDAGTQLRAGGSLTVHAGEDVALAGAAVADGAVRIEAARGLRVDGSALVHAGPLDLKSGGDLRLGAGGQLQGQGVRTEAGRDLVLDGVLASTVDADLRARRNLHANGKAVANGALRADAAGNLTIGEAGLAQGSSQLELGAGQDLRIAGTAGTAAGAGVGARTVGGALQAARTAGGILQAQAGRDLFITGTATAGSPIVLGAQRDIRLDGIATALEGDLTADAGANLRVGAAGRLQASDSLSARAGADLDSDGVVAAGGGLTLAARGDILLGGVVAALGERAVGNASITAARDFIVKQNGQLQAAGTLTARVDRDLYAAGVLSSVGDMLLDAARDARTDGFAATHANLTLTGRDVTVGPSGVAQAGGNLTASAQGALQAAGRLLAGGSQALIAGDTITIDGTVAALQGDLSLTAQRGDIALGAASRLQAGGALTAQANGALTALGSAATEQGMTLRAGTDATLGGITATQAGNLVVSAADKLAVTADSRLQAGAALDLSAGGALLNSGVASADTHAKLRAGSALDNAGSVLAGGDLIATASGSLSNAGRFVAGVGADGALNQPGSITLTADAIVHGGTSLAGTDLSLSAGGLNLADGKLSAVGGLVLATPGSVDTRNAVVQSGALDITAATLHNQRGQLTSTGDAAINLSAALNNTDGGIAAAGNARIEAARLVNREGTLAAHDLAITASGALDNRGGLIQADNTLALNAARLDNRGPGAAGLGNRSIPDAARPPTGVLGKVVSLMADRIDNRSGDIQGVEALSLTSSHLDNTGGQIASLGDSRIVADTLRNSHGQLHANRTLTVIVQALQGVGSLQSAGDLGLQHAGSLDQDGDISSGRDLSLVIGGALDNRARVSAGRDLSITADSLKNQASGALLAAGVNTIAVAQGLTNAGLIDGGSTRITAGQVDNTGRIYGDAVSIQAGALVNGADGGGSGGAVIASRADLDLGVASLVNRDHALIHADADLRIGGALDGSGHAIGQAASLVNASATIEAAGNADISAASLRNQNDRYASVTVQVSSTPKVYFTPAGTTDMYDAASHWLCDEVTPMCSKDPAWLNDDPERMFLLPSAKYPESRYGPPFDYAPSLKGKGGKTSPITPTYTPVTTVCDGTGGDAGAICSDVPEKFRYGAHERIWSVFGVTPPSGPMPVWTAPERACYNHATCDAEAARRKVYEEAYAAYKAPHMALDARIREFNADFNNRLVGTFTYYQVQETVSETRTLSSDPGKILSGGAMMLTGAVANDKSQIAAGGALTVAGPAIHNIGAGGERIITRVGTATVTQARSRDRQEYTSAYRNTLAGQPIELPVGTSGGNLTVPLNGSRPGASHGGIAPGPVQVASVSLPGATVVRSVSSPAAVPDNQLFAVNGRADAPYLVATDPHFVGQRPVVSSDYLLNLLAKPGAQPGAQWGDWDTQAPAGAMFLTPSGQPKRLGDGFYEQKLVSDQILATTGQRFLDTYSDNDSQYKALLAAGAQFARGHGIQLGVALTEAQQRQLTTDLVWLVEQTVTLPDGTTETVLVPQVYLLVREGDLKGDGTLMAGRNVKLAAEGDIANSGTIGTIGTIGARAATVMTAGNIVNQRGGLIQGATVDLAAREDLTNLVSLIKGDAVTLKAGRDIALTSIAASENFGSTWGTHVSGVSRVDAGNLNMQAGRDITLTAAQVSVKDDARLQAGRDIALETLTENHGETLVLNKNNRHDLSTSSEVGSTVAAGGNLALVAGQDINARAAEVTAGKQLAVGAGRDLHLVAGAETGSAYDEVRYKTKRFLSSKTTHTITSSDWEQSKASTFTGDTAVLMAGRDLNVVGSNVGAQKDLVLSAERDVNLLPGQNTEDRYDYKMVKKSGFGAMGGFSYGTRKQTDWIDGEKVFNTASTVGSVEGDALIKAGKALDITGSNVLARQGDITLIGQEVNIGAALDTSREKEFHEIKQTGLTLTVSNPIVSAVQTGIRMAEAAGKTDNTVMKGLAGATAGVAAVNAYDAVRASAKAAEAAELAKAGSSNKIDQVGGVSIKLSLGTSKSSSTTDRSSSSAHGSTITAGRDLTVVAQGASKDSDIAVTGSTLSAGDKVALKAEGDVILQAARNAFEQQTDSKSSSASIGIGYSTGGKQNGFTLELGASLGRGKANGKDESWTNSLITAGKVLAIQSGGDTTLKGATGEAERIVASVGGNLLLESLQDRSKYDSKNQSAGFGLSLCIPPYCQGASSFSANASAGKMHSDFKSVMEQTGLRAGDGGFQIDVKNETKLVGSVIASSDRAVAQGLNTLDTGTLITEDIKNRAKYSGGQVSIGGGFGFGGGKGADAGLGTTKGGQVAGGASKEHGSSVATGSGGFGMGTPIVVGAKGSSSSTTQSAISGGTVVIRDEAAQQHLTGMTAAETIVALNRDTSDTLNALKPIFDKEKIEAGFEIASEAQRQAGQFLENRAKEAKALSDELATELKKPGGGDPARIAQLTDDLGDAAKWEPGGQYRLIATAILGGATGNVTGAVSAVAKAGAVNYLQGLTAKQIKLYSDALGDGADAQAARAALHTLVGCAAGSARGDGCGASALGAGAASVVNVLLDATSGKSGSALSPEDKEARSNLVSSLLAGVAVGLGADASAVVNSGRSETENNAVGTLLKRGGMAAVGACFRSPACEEKVIGPIAFAAITAVTADLMGKTRGLSEDQALLLAVVRYIATGGEPQSIPGKPGEPVPPVGVPPGGGVGTAPDTQLPGKSGDVPEIGAPGQEGTEVGGGELISTPNDGPIIVDPILSSNKELQRRAKELGYAQRIPPQKAPFNSHGQVVFWNGKNYITPDVDAHNVSDGWKVFNRQGKRVGTYDSNLNWVKE
ncbi:hemagglutinin repeat-containing protein [Achromobacter insolitus]|uniref:hemagglutinin repeat-containing protein n=2 Tax=Achromobacter insolitus TaxID=217204 RepID=UPI00165595D4|nr:hemagglutinin repeat-containing protein [Achromobacter insolitus]